MHISKIFIIAVLGAVYLNGVNVAQSRDLVKPSEAANLPPIELGEVVKLFMPDQDREERSYLSFRQGADSENIYWLTNGVEENENGSSRVGLVRIRVEGERSTTLKQRNIELAWKITLSNSSMAKFSVENIEIRPDKDCFGPLTEGCYFEPEKSLKDSGILFELMCKKDYGANHARGYRLHSYGKKDIFAHWFASGGSGGYSAWFEILINKPSGDLCSI